jgi:hypothetical protein
MLGMREGDILDASENGYVQVVGPWKRHKDGTGAHQSADHDTG